MDSLRSQEKKSQKSCRTPKTSQPFRIEISEWIIEGETFVLGRSPAFQQSLRELELVADHDVTVLIEGESGTGKELFCRALHSLSPRRAKRFVAVNCAALPRELLENELFGHSRGAYTHAYSEEGGLLAEADGGTLFLDEVASLELGTQSKLLRLLDRGEFRRVGDPRARVADIRIVAACNTCLKTEVEAGRFRLDLYYRLTRYLLKLPPLRERLPDIPLLVGYFLRKHSLQFGLAPPELSPEALGLLMAHPWRGNVRELENVVLRTILRQPGQLVTASDLQLGEGTVPVGPPGGVTTSAGASLLDAPFRQKKAEAVRQFERTYLAALLTTHRGNVSQAARAAGKNRRALTSLLNKHRLNPDLFRR
jgi:transcriptional regulator with GAF, ATPase, and Fis domain